MKELTKAETIRRITQKIKKYLKQHGLERTLHFPVNRKVNVAIKSPSDVFSKHRIPKGQEKGP